MRANLRFRRGQAPDFPRLPGFLCILRRSKGALRPWSGCRDRSGSLRLALQAANPLAEVERRGAHFGLVITHPQTTPPTAACAMVADEIGDDALDRRTQLQVLTELGGLGIGARFGKGRAMIADENLAHARCRHLVAATSSEQRTVLALIWREAKAAPVSTLRSVSRGADPTLRACQRLLIGR